jgi:NADPH:quinone reductase
MTAAVLTNPGPSPPSECFTYSHDYPRPTLPSPDWILVRVHAAGLNRAELRSRTGVIPFPPEFNIWIDEYHEDPPKILGEELVGVVEEPGTSTSFKKGEKVAAWIYGGGKAHDGAYAEFSLCHKRRLYRLPETQLSWNVLGAIPMSMWTAYGCVEVCGGLSKRSKGSTVLVHGGTSSVGVWAVLLARDQGATVLATTRNPDKVDKLKAAGAHHVLLEDKIEEEVHRLYPQGVDVVVELVSPGQCARLLCLTARHGTLTVAGVLGGWEAKDFYPLSVPTARNLSFYTMTNSGIGHQDDGLENVEQILADAVKKVESGNFASDAFLDRTFSLAEIGDAHAYMDENKATGKVVVTVP